VILPLIADVVERLTPLTNVVNPFIAANGVNALSVVIEIIVSLIVVLITGMVLPVESVIVVEMCLVSPKPATVSGPTN
jgi:hypothetical protein